VSRRPFISAIRQVFDEQLTPDVIFAQRLDRASGASPRGL
jgi:hypothetical protein